MSNSIIGGFNNTATNTNTIIVGQGSIGVSGSIGVCGSIGMAGSIGANGTGGPGSGAYQITDWKEELMKKYNNRFTIKTDYDSMTFAPTNVITDTNTNKEYKFTPKSISNIVNETDLFIQALITIIRDEKLDNIING
jgi:hypothetical protein